MGLKTGLYAFEKCWGSFRFSKACSCLHDLCSLPNIIGVTKSRGMRWAGHVAGVGDRTDESRGLVGDLMEPTGRPRRRGEIKLK